MSDTSGHSKEFNIPSGIHITHTFALNVNEIRHIGCISHVYNVIHIVAGFGHGGTFLDATLVSIDISHKELIFVHGIYLQMALHF